MRDFSGTTGQPGHTTYFIFYPTARTRGSVTLDPVSQSVIHVYDLRALSNPGKLSKCKVYDLRALSNPGKLSKCKILVSFPGLVDLNADLAKISNSPGNCFQDQLEQAGSNDPGLQF